MIECKNYNLTELRTVLNIPVKQWERRREDLLEHLKLYFDYEVTTAGKGYCFTIYEQYSEYEPLPRKNSKKPEMNKYYYEQTCEEVKEQPWNTGSNIARNIIAKDKNKYNHAEKTMVNYIRPIVKDKFVHPCGESQWMRLSTNRLCYEPLTEEQLNFLNDLFEKNTISKQQAEIISDYRSKYITKREASEQLFTLVEGSYASVMSQFKSKFGFVPIKIKYLQENAIKEGEFDF